MAENSFGETSKSRAISGLLTSLGNYSEQHPWIKNLIFIPAIWAVVSAGATGLLYSGLEVGRYFYQSLPVNKPEPFREDRVGILIARFENDPDGEYSRRVRTALERQFPVSADGSAAVEVDFYPDVLSLPAQGRLSESLERAREQGMQWLEEQNAELLIWGRAVPSEKELELRILTRQSTDSAGIGRPELYPIRIPSEFSDQIGASLAGLVAGAGYSAWSQRGEFLTPEKFKTLSAWLTRLKTLRDELQTSLDDDNRKQIYRKITTAYAQIGAALIADGNTEIVTQVMNDILPREDDKGGIFASDPLLFAEIIADVVARFSVEAGNISNNDLETLLKMVNDASDEFRKRHDAGEIADDAHAYLNGLMCMLAGDLYVRSGDRKNAITRYTDGRKNFQKLLDSVGDSQDALSRARLQSYLGDVELGLAQQLPLSEGEAVLASSISNLGKALQAISADTAPRERVRVQYLMSAAYYQRWAMRFDAMALQNVVLAFQEVANILLNSNRSFQATSAALQAARMANIHAFIASGPDMARQSLQLIDSVAPSENQASNPYVAHQIAAAGYARCSAHIGIGYRQDKTANAKARMDEIENGLKNCEQALTLFEQHGDRFGWLDTKLLIADAYRLKAEVIGDPSPARTALAVAEDAKSSTADLSDPGSKNQIAGTTGAILRALGTLEKDQELLKQAVEIHRAGLEVLPEGAVAVQRLFTELQYAKSLVALGLTEKTSVEELKEGISLLKEAHAEFAARGAVLVAGDAEKALKEAESHLSKLSTN